MHRSKYHLYSITSSARANLINISAKAVGHGRYVVVEMARLPIPNVRGDITALLNLELPSDPKKH